MSKTSQQLNFDCLKPGVNGKELFLFELKCPGWLVPVQAVVAVQGNLWRLNFNLPSGTCRRRLHGGSPSRCPLWAAQASFSVSLKGGFPQQDF
eukprot:5027795-Amphidinium_carterae.1